MNTNPRTAVRVLASARVISLSGGAAAYVALNFEIYQRTHSATWVAAALFLTFGTVGFASPFAGALGDRFDRQKVMVCSEVAGAIAFGAMALVHDPVLLLAFAFLSALAEAPFMSSSAAAVPNLVPEEDIPWANGMLSIGRNAGILIGPVIGGVMVAGVGAGAVFALNAVTFLVSAAIIGGVRGRFAGDRGDGEHRGLAAGLRYLFRDRVLRLITLAWLTIVLGLGATMVADVALAEVFEAGSFGFGVFVASWGAGSILGSLLGTRVRRHAEAWVIVIGAAVVGLTAMGVGLAPWFWFACVAIVFMGVADAVMFVAEQSIMQRRTPDAVRSRVSGGFDAVVHIGLAVSYVAAGPVVDLLGAKGTYLAGGLVSLLGVALVVPILREMRDTTSASPVRVESDATELVLGFSAGDREAAATHSR